MRYLAGSVRAGSHSGISKTIASPTANFKLRCALALAPCLASAAAATDRHVPGGYTTIQAAINASSNGDHVKLAPGDYSGEGNQDLDFQGRQLTIEPATEGDTCRILPEVGHRGFIFDDAEGPLARIVGLTVTQGATESAGGTAILISGAGPTFIDCTFSNCSTTGWGGAIRIDQGSPTFARCTMAGNTAARGGAVHFDSGEAFFMDCIFQSNYSAATGGAVSHGSGTSTNVNYSGCTFAWNYASSGGAIMFEDGSHTAQLLNCRFNANQVATLGGAVRTGAGFNGTAINCQFLFNAAQDDGRAWFDNGADRVDIMNCSIAMNFPIDSEKNAAVLLRAQAGSIANCILWDNGPVVINLTLAGPIDVHDCCIEGGFAGNNNIDVDPQIDPTDPFALRLLPTSPTIDLGNDSVLPGSVIFDIDGNPRQTDGDGDGTAAVDMGAYEAAGVCIGDLDRDGDVAFSDLILLLSTWGPCPGCPADLDGSGDIDFGDLVVLLAAWGPCSQ